MSEARRVDWRVEVEFVDRLEVREAGPAGKALEAGLLPMCDLLADEESEEVAVRPGGFLGAAHDVPVDAAHVREVEPTQQRFEFLLSEEVLVRAGHWRVSEKRIGRCRACST